jgi:hypothetical protein
MDMAKIGEGTLASAARLGLAELRNAVTSRESIAASPDQGMYGNLTPGEISSARDGNQEVLSMNDLRSSAQEKAREQEKEQGKDGPDQERGMER